MVGRDIERSQVLEHLEDGSWPGCVFLGPPGIGTTALARSILAELGTQGRPLLWLGASRGTANVPLGCFAPLVGRVPSDDIAPAVRRQLTDLLEAQRDVVVMIDDAHYLDAVSGALLAHLVEGAHARVIATSKWGHLEAAESLVPLLDLGLEVRVVEPLAEEQSKELYAALTGGARDAGAAAAHRRAGGRPALVVAQARERSMARVPHLVGSWLASLGGPAAAAARFLAAGSSLPAQLAIRVAGASPIVRLERARLAAGFRSGRRLYIGLDPPLLSEIIWGGLGLVERQIVLRELADSSTALPQRRADDARLAVELAGRGGPQPSEELLGTAARRAVESGDGRLAGEVAKLTEAAGTSNGPEVSGHEIRDGGPDDLVSQAVLSRARHDLGRWSRAVLGEPVADVAPVAATARSVTILVEGLIAAAAGDLGQATRLLGTGTDACRDAEPPWLGPVAAALSAALAAELGRAAAPVQPAAGSAVVAEAGWLRAEGVLAVAHAWRLHRSRPDPVQAARLLATRIGGLVDHTGDPNWALLALLVACRFDRVDGLEKLIAEAAEDVGSTAAARIASLGFALVEHDVATITGSGVVFAQLGLGPLAAECYHAAAGRAAASGDETASHRFGFRRDAVLRRCQSPVLSRTQPVLSTREAEIVTLLGDETSNRELAGCLFLSRRTVENHLARIYRRLGVGGRSELMALRDEAGWAPAG